VVFRHDYPLRLGDDLTPRCGDPPPPGRAPMLFTEDHLSCRVPPGSFFVLADNRMSLQDSRIWGAVPDELLIGRVLSIWWSAGRAGGSLERVGPVP
jgi:signal peptidase I